MVLSAKISFCVGLRPVLEAVECVCGRPHPPTQQETQDSALPLLVITSAANYKHAWKLKSGLSKAYMHT